jgi:hypothetical protein
MFSEIAEAEETVQRKLAAIMSADVVGYSRLMGLDEAETLKRLSELRRAVMASLNNVEVGLLGPLVTVYWRNFLVWWRPLPARLKFSRHARQ